jgi:hypothetical protein
MQKELLQALEALLSMPEYDGTRATSIIRRDIKRAARAAIKKARAA